jgi:hypothetical protein
MAARVLGSGLGLNEGLVSSGAVAPAPPARYGRCAGSRRSPSAARLSPKILIGHLCAVCNDAVDHVGTLGPSSLERALVAHLTPDQLGMLPYGQLSVSGLVGWAVAAYEDSSTPANSSPFGHLADIEALPGKLRAALGG